MCDRASVGRLVVLAGALALLAACTTTGGTSGPATTAEVNYPDPTMAGDSFLPYPDIVVQSVTLPTEEMPYVSFVLENRGKHDYDGLSAQVIFCSPPGDEEKVQEFNTEVADQRFYIVKGGTREIRAKTSNPADVEVVFMKVVPALTVARELVDTRADRWEDGTRYLDGKLECIELVNDLSSPEPNLSFRLANRSTERLRLLEYKVLVLRADTDPFDSGWIPIEGEIPSGEATTIDPELPRHFGSAGVVLLVQEST